MKLSTFEGKVIVITGGAGVLGSSFVRRIAREGGTAIAADMDLGAAKQLADEIGDANPGQVQASHLDITSEDSVKRLITDLQQRYGRIDAVVNNAYPRNTHYGRTLEDVTYADFCQNTGMHLGGYFLVAQQFCLAFREQGGGNVVNMSSIYGTVAPRFQIYEGTLMTMPVEYAAIKSAIIQLTRYFAQYFKRDGIRVNCLSPGGVLAAQPDTFLHAYNSQCASKGMLDAEDLLGALVFLLSDDSRYMTGQNVIVDDGFSL